MTKANNAPFTWFGLTVPDKSAVANFYRDLFGWQTDVIQMSDRANDVFMHNGTAFAHYDQSQAPQADAAYWIIMISCDDTEATCNLITENGGNIMFGPLFLPDVGTIAIAADSAGAVFGVHSSEKTDRNSGNEAPFAWFDVSTRDVGATRKFYESVFGWETEDWPESQLGPYTMFKNNGHTFAGIADYADPNMGVDPSVPNSWQIYMFSSDVDHDAEKVKQLGGGVVMEAFDLETVGRMAMVHDNQGAHFWLFKPETMV